MDVYLCGLRRLAQAQPDNAEVQRRYICALERALGGNTALADIERETSVDALLKIRSRIYDSLDRAISKRVEEIRAACVHEWGDQLYGRVHIYTSCKKCGRSEAT